MTRDETLNILRDHSAEIRERFGVQRLRLFGSAARNQTKTDSDIDVLVELNDELTFDSYFDLKFFLEDFLGRTVDLVTESGLRPEVRPYVEQDAIEIT